MAEKVGRDHRLPMPLEVFRRPNHSMSLGPAERNCNHVAGNEARNPDSQIKPVLDDIDHLSFSYNIDIHVGIAAQELKHER
ncbi:hypothetical protein D9M68_880690 [compost metagenome]